jgi:hypothetical protein
MGAAPAWAAPHTNNGEPAGYPRRHTYYCESIDEVMNVAKGMHNLDTYFGVAARHSAEGTKESVASSQCVWADVDAKRLKGGKYAAYKGLTHDWADLYKPTFIVDSGHGYHGYWIFDRPQTDLGRIERINKGIAGRTNGDHTFNINRLMRLPGSTNWKVYDKYQPCRIVQYTGQYYEIDSFEELEEEARENHLEPLGCAASIHDIAPISIQELPQAPGSYWTNLIVLGISGDTECKYLTPEGEPDRSALDFAAIIRLISLAATDEQIMGIFINREHGISEKTLSKREPHRIQQYLSYTIGKARALVESR